jgi:hypothetical protein
MSDDVAVDIYFTPDGRVGYNTFMIDTVSQKVKESEFFSKVFLRNSSEEKDFLRIIKERFGKNNLSYRVNKVTRDRFEEVFRSIVGVKVLV